MAYLGEEPKFGSFASETFSGNGSATSFTLTHGAASPSSLLVTIDGVKQQTTAYTITDTALDFGSGNAPAAGTNNIEVVYLGTKTLVGTVADGAITTSKIAANAVTGAKIAMGSDAAGDILTYTGTDYVRLAKGTASQTLMMNTGASAVEWATASGLSESCNFRARITSDQSNVTGNGTSYNMTGAIWTEDWDIGSDFSNGTFTAPANGYYLLGFSAYLNQTNGVTDMTFNIVTPAGTHVMSRGNWSYGTGGTGYASPSSARSGITQSGVFYIANAGTAHCNLQGYNAGSDTVDVTAFSTFFWGMRVM